MDKHFFSLSSSMLRTIIYTIGHICIAIVCVVTITGSDVTLATIDALIEPLINAVWYFALDYLWSKHIERKRVSPT